MNNEYLKLIINLYIRDDIVESDTIQAIKSDFLTVHSGDLRSSKIQIKKNIEQGIDINQKGLII